MRVKKVMIIITVLIVLIFLSLIIIQSNTFIYKKVVIYQLGLDHDTFIWLEKKSGKSDIEPLILSLKSFPDIKDGEPMVCIRDHLLKALKNATRVDVGLNYGDWDKWFYQRFGRELDTSINLNGTKNKLLFRFAWEMSSLNFNLNYWIKGEKMFD